MLRKKNRAGSKEERKSSTMPDLPTDTSANKSKSASFFSVPGLLVGFQFSSKPSAESDPSRSPTSPLDFRGFSSSLNPLGSPRRGFTTSQKCWDCGRVGLSIVDSLTHGPKPPANFAGFCDSPNILLGSQMRIPVSCQQTLQAPKSLPTDHPLPTKIAAKTPLPKSTSLGMISTSDRTHLQCRSRSCSSGSFSPTSTMTRLIYCDPTTDSQNLRSIKPPSPLNGLPHVRRKSSDGVADPQKRVGATKATKTLPMDSLSASEIELSEDYTRIISHGPNPKTTHIFGDCILECRTVEPVEYSAPSPISENCSGDMLLPRDYFLGFCFCCKKKLEQGEDIYMYRGERAFCSEACRLEGINGEEGLEEALGPSSPSTWEKFYLAVAP